MKLELINEIKKYYNAANKFKHAFAKEKNSVKEDLYTSWEYDHNGIRIRVENYFNHKKVFVNGDLLIDKKVSSLLSWVQPFYRIASQVESVGKLTVYIYGILSLICVIKVDGETVFKQEYKPPIIKK